MSLTFSVAGGPAAEIYTDLRVRVPGLLYRITPDVLHANGLDIDDTLEAMVVITEEGLSVDLVDPSGEG